MDGECQLRWHGAVDNRGWTLGHRPSLDALRGIAVLLVLLSHFHVPLMTGGGQVGVSLFFVLSGYLITALLLGEQTRGRADLRAFYIRRARRLLPALAVLLVGIGVWATATGQLRTWLPDAVAVSLYVGNWWYLAGHDMAGLAHTWSLAVEEQFYIVWPALLVVLGRRAMPVAILCVGVSFALTVAHLGDPARALYGSDVRVKDLLLGALVALASMRLGRDLRMPTYAAIAAAGVLALTVTMPPEPLLVSVPCAVLVAWVAARPNFAAWRPLTFTGRISYGLYLFHYPLSAGAIFDGYPVWPRTVALFVASYALAVASWFGVERRFLRRHDDAANRQRLWAKTRASTSASFAFVSLALVSIRITRSSPIDDTPTVDSSPTTVSGRPSSLSIFARRPSPFE